MSAPTVSAIIPVHNRPEMMQEAVASVVRQTYRHIEIVIVDDGSTGGTADVGRHLAAETPQVIRYLRQENQGPGVARRTGLAQARGDFIQYLDSDDLLEPQKFERQVRKLSEHETAGVCYCITRRIDMRTGTTRIWSRTGERIDSIFPSFLMKRGWDTNSPLWRRNACEAIGPWGDYRVMEDWEHDLRAGILGVKAVHVPEPLVVVRDHEEGRASGMHTGFTPALTHDFFRAHRSIWLRMRAAGLTDWSYVQGFSRKMFWIARMCGQRGLTEDAEEALGFALEMVATHHPPRELRAFGLLTRILGWQSAVAVSESARRLLRRETNHADS